MELLDRERELAAVDELVERGGVVMVEGRAGIGKTALLLDEPVADAGAYVRDSALRRESVVTPSETRARTDANRVWSMETRRRHD